jgi:glyoxylase-like metal-dependent hydrolase (beta-lactamase superfamily II)
MKLLTGLLAALLAPVAIAAPAPTPTPTLPSPDDGYFQQITRVGDGLWLIAQPQPFHIQPIGNVVVIEQSDGLVLLDSGGSPGAGRRIVELLATVSEKPVKAVALSHWHGDHVLGLSAIAQRWPKLEVIATATTAGHLAGKSMRAYPKGAPDAALQAAFDQRLDGIDGFLRDTLAKPELGSVERRGFERSQRLFQQYRIDTRGMYLVLPTRTFDDRLVLEDAKRPVELLHPGRGNTDGDLVAWLPRQRVMATGDLVVAPIPFGFNVYPADWQRALQALDDRHPALWLPGHGAAMRDDRYVRQLIQLIAASRTAVASEVGNGVARDKLKLDLSSQRGAFVGDDDWLLRWFDRYWTQPFGDAAWREASGQPIEQGEG